MSNLSSVTASNRESWSRATDAAGSAPTTGSSAPTGPSRVDIDASVDRLVGSSVALPGLVARMDPVGAKLDQMKAAASGPYVVGGAVVYSGAQFRMVGGHNENAVPGAGRRAPAAFATLSRVATSAGLAEKLPLLQEGRAAVADLVRITQALIDDGQLPEGEKTPLPDQIHAMQWRFGIGLDCAGYVHQAVEAAHGSPGKLGLSPSPFENFTGLPQNPRFTKMEPAAARPGDVLVLAGRGVQVGDPGHNLIVRSHATLSPPGEAVTGRWSGAAVFIEDAARTGATIHMFEVDSSFSAGHDGNPRGGVRRDVLLWNSSTKVWCTCKDVDPPVAQSVAVPYGERAVTGFFRPKVAR